MNTAELELVNPQEYGLEEKTAIELTTGLKQVIAERELLIGEFESVSKLEVSKETIPQFKELRLKIQKNRTLGINNWHKVGKEYFLRGGQFLDAIKRKENAINEAMEETLMNGEKHFENLEKERLVGLQSSRELELSKYVEDASERDLSGMDEDVWNAFLGAKKSQYEDRVAAEKKAEADRIEREKKEAEEREAQRLENIRLKEEADKREAAIQAERLEREKVEKERLEKERVENEKREALAKKEREEQAAREAKIKAENDAKLKKEREEREAIQRELEAKKAAEAKALADAELAKQSELSKGDEAKFQDLLTDLESLKSKYQFKSENNVKMYQDVGVLLDKVINHIKK